MENHCGAGLSFIFYVLIPEWASLSMKLQYHVYADDTQLYCAFHLHSPDETLSTISACFSDIRTWMIRNKLKINDDKTEFLLLNERIVLEIWMTLYNNNAMCCFSADK